MIILPINHDPELAKKVIEAAQEDGDDVLYPTHYALEDGQIIGAFSLETPISTWWMHKTKGNAKKTMLMLNSLETLHSDRGNPAFVMPCTEESPYFRMMEKFGFQKLGEPVQWFYKNLYPLKP
jgi:hypothetical protein